MHLNNHKHGLPPRTEELPAEEAAKVLQLYHDAAAGIDGVMVLTIIDPKKTTNNVRVHHFAIGDVEGMAREAVARSQYDNVYFSPAVFRKDLPPGKRGKFEDIRAVLGGVIDDDGDTGKRALPPRGIETSIEVTTCTNPTTNRHIHVAFNRPLPPHEAKPLLELLHRKCGGDSGTKDADHVWRVPGTRNHPNATKLKRGRPPDPQLVQLTGGSFKPIDPDELKRALEAMPDLKPQVRTANGNGANGHAFVGRSAPRSEIIARLPGYVHDLIETEIIEGDGDRSSHSYRTMRDLMDHGLSDDEVLAVAEGAPFAKKYEVRGDLPAEIERVRARWSGEGGRLYAPLVVPSWPVPQGPVFHGIAGEVAKLATANSEADPIA
jgi:hypothetical protein